jgi:rSAM/selenodomain-associated transferase 1
MVELAGAHALAILTRAPSSGGKTRLFAELGIPPDRRLLEALLLDTVEGASLPEVRTVIAVTPASSCDEIRVLVGGSTASNVEVVAQPEGDLGDRMRGTMSALFARGASAVVLIGSDLPHIDSAAIRAALYILTRDPGTLVLGPATDGGYYLIGATHVPDVFGDVAWSTPDVLAQTARAAGQRGVRVEYVAPLEDVDTAEALRRLPGRGHAPRTNGWVRAALN